MLKNKIKTFLLLLFLITFFTLISAISYASNVSYDLGNSVFRLHVIANSDSKEDQNLKYIVRDEVLKYISSLTNDLQNKNEVISLISKNREEIKQVAQNTVMNNGYNYNVDLEIGNFLFPTKTYGDISFPAGYYDALKIEIGEAKGKNWWCVMFPPLCFIDVTSGIVPEESKDLLEESLLEEEYDLISNNNNSMNVKFKIVEFFNNLTAKIKT